ncbi:unnamed protein product [Diatraea saccharalis]|uniref:Uncharacterized protein n=1 Tax=Diatraea saccharalis TaxID=40085 RepID=A0A9N9RFS4_9NEOP|nr:unnamed protein product [Diatraea saccharalis]
MDNSQSTDVFSDLTLTNQSCTITASASNAMDMDTYEALINRTKASLCNDISAFFNTSLPDNFTLLLKDCHYCISQALKLLVEISESHSSTQKLLHYIEDAVNILNLLCSFIKRIIENFAMSCSTMKTFPTTTGQIIMDIFIHCRNSETIYSIHLTSIQQELKDLFRSCHELQLTYLMVLEKHFIFDLTQKEELDILVKALNINLHIGEVVQTLDVKTLAEQWKAYTMICEKYASHLVDTNICCECIKLLCSMVLNNMNTSLEVEQEEKLIVRSMKVAYFTIKILMRICNIFEQSSTKQYKCIVDMLINVYL